MSLMLYQNDAKTKNRRDVVISTVTLVEHRGFEPLTPTLPVSCAPNCANAPRLDYSILRVGGLSTG